VNRLQRGNVLFMCPPSLTTLLARLCVSVCLKRIFLSKMGLELPPVFGLGLGGPGVELHCLPIFIFIRNGRLHTEPCCASRYKSNFGFPLSRQEKSKAQRQNSSLSSERLSLPPSLPPSFHPSPPLAHPPSFPSSQSRLCLGKRLSSSLR